MSLSSLAIWFLSAALCYVVVVLVASVVIVLMSREENPEFSEIKLWLRCLLKNGYDGENVLFLDTQKNRFIRFEKYTDIGATPGIKLTFPEIGWGEEFLSRLREYAEHKGLALRTSKGSEPDYTHVKVGDDVNAAFDLCRMIWTKFYGFAERAPWFPQTGDLSSINELVDASVQSQPSDVESEERHLQYFNARLRHAGLQWLQATSLTGVKTAVGVFFFWSGMGFVLALVGLPVSTLVTLGDPPGWQLDLGQIVFQGNWTSLVFFVLYLLSIAAWLRFRRFPLINRQNVTGAEKILHTPKQLVFVTIPVAVLLVWLRI